jgi:four helix bundle protein
VFAHEQLQVYAKALDFAAKAASWGRIWDKKHALVDHLSRATESVVVNLAEAARQRATPGRLRITDYAIGSSLECAGCLDLARIKGLLSQEEARQEKAQLCEVTKMLIGLRKAWGQLVCKEDQAPYLRTSAEGHQAYLFHHEELVVYQRALGFMEWLVARIRPDAPWRRVLRQLDEAGTSIVLNIAEGNGRYAELDHQQFLKIAQTGAVKASVYVDLCVREGLWPEPEGALGKEHLRQVDTLLGSF